MEHTKALHEAITKLRLDCPPQLFDIALRIDDCAGKVIDQLAAAQGELKSMASGVKVSVPSDTMEQAFQTHYRCGFEAGKKAAQDELAAIRKDADFYQDQAHKLRAELSSVKAENVKLRDLVKQVIDEDEGMYVMGKAWHDVARREQALEALSASSEELGGY